MSVPPGFGGRPRVVIVGAGFAGLAAAKALRRVPVEVTLLDQHNHHVFTPFLYQVATALLEPSEVAAPVRSLLRRLGNVTFRLGRVTDVHLLAKQVETDHGPIPYDYLVLAAGSVSNYFHNTDIATRSLGLKDLAEALQLRNHILSRFEQASWVSDPAERTHLLSFAVVGGGPTGVEFAAALAVLVAGIVERDFPAVHRDDITITLVEGAPDPLGSFPKSLRTSATEALSTKGVNIRSLATVTDIDKEGLVLDDGKRIDAATVVWAAGVRADPLAEALGVELGSHGRVPVGPTLQLTGHPEVFVVGDLAEIPTGGQALPMLAQVAIQSGRHAGHSIVAQISGHQPRPFHYRNLGTMAAVGRNDAIAEIGPLRLSGFTGWLAWLLVHIVRTVGVQARASVVISWISGYLFADRPVRLITGPRQDSSANPPPPWR
ncbi:MAG: FAD-dependent oxidoreductase [Pseudonocardiales bacterium]|nr:MAG: FAD-dependent oxidoreductase [Pseudonocardiales bacterium]